MGQYPDSYQWYHAGTKRCVSSAGRIHLPLPLGSSPLELKCILFWHSVQLIRNLVTASLGRKAYVSAIWENNETAVCPGWGRMANGEPGGGCGRPSAPSHLACSAGWEHQRLTATHRSLQPSPGIPESLLLEQLLMEEHFGRVTGVSERHWEANEQTFGLPA